MTLAVDPTQPDEFGPYELYERLGLGGMATVHRAKKRGIEGFERIVALKRMLSHLAEDGSFVDSFIREAKVASLLHHPNIAQVYDFGRIGGVYYIAMELVSGFDLRKLLRYANRSNEPIPLPVVLSILGELCEALDYAHAFVDERGTPPNIVHRDISPSNLIIAHTGHLKVIDFGIAKASSRQLHTESGQVKGKLGYMSPEAALGLNLGPVADVFSVGVVAWELITASPLFSARTDFETMRRIREADIEPPSKLNPTCPPALDSIVLSALNRDPDRRLASAGAFRTALDGIAARGNIQVSARSVAEWITQFVQAGDGWSHQPSASASRLPLPPEPPTSVVRPSRSVARLKRSTEDIKLASEIWGDDIATAASGSPGPDFHASLATPLPTRVLPPALAAARQAETVSTVPVTPPPIASQAVVPSPVAPQAVAAPVPDLRGKKSPVAILVVLALIAAALGAVLWWKQTQTTAPAAPATATVRFVIQPAGAIIEIAGKEVGRTSPFDAELAPGAYAVVVRQDGFKPWTDTIAVREGERQAINVALDRIPEVATGTNPPVHEPKAKAPIKATPAPPTKSNRTRTVVASGQRHDPETAKEPDPEPTPPVVVTPKVDPPKPDPIVVTPVKPDKPARTPVVAASAVSKLSGEIPALKGTGSESNGDVLVKMCIDESGAVSSVKVVKSTAAITADLERALQGWRYKPYVNQDKKASAVCFPLSLRVVFKRAD